MKKLMILGLIMGLAFAGKLGAQEKGGGKNLLAYWSFDEGKGETVIDYSGNKNGGVIEGEVKWVKGVKGTALEFNGKAAYVNCGDNASLASESITMEAWVKTNNLSRWAGIVSNKIDVNHGINIQIGTANNIAALVSDGGSSAYLSTSWVPSTNTWYHVAVTHNGSDNKTVLYVNGNTEAVLTFPLKYFTPTDKTTIGVFYTSLYHFFDGVIDEVKIYNRALNSDEIKASYDSKANYLK